MSMEETFKSTPLLIRQRRAKPKENYLLRRVNIHVIKNITIMCLGRFLPVLMVQL